ncbi:MAG TPA: type II toxin-antitoxin system PemK/MazF family toxin [Pirellulales bacterium]|nr:type II toxin-antitoxin system PemK/MazF family toxin [Pirellulales bacterium]HVC97564.1 type II toxin-antitoxin system PemK/MazF family toxin [Pirellulales bacterium]
MKRGDVVIVDFPYSDQTGSKLRPAPVVQADALNQKLDDTILALITSSSPFTPGGSAARVTIEYR